MKVGKASKIIISGLVCTLFLVGCGSGGKEAGKGGKESTIEVEKTGFPITKEKVTFKMMGPNVGLAEWKDMSFFKEYADMTNIDFEFTTPPMSDFGTKLNLAMASGDLPDVIYAAGESNLTPAMEMDYGKQGILIPLEGYIDEYMPNFKKVLEEDDNIRRAITTPEGHIYSLPSVSREYSSVWPRGPMWYRGEWLEALDVKELPKTTDEFYELLVRFRDEDPNGNGKKDEIPLTDVKMESTRPWLMSAFGLKAFGLHERDGKVEYAPMTENYKGYLEFMNKLYSEKLLDQEVFGQSQDQTKAKGQNNQLGLFPDWFSFFTTGKDEKDALGEPMFHPLTSEYSKEAVVPKGSGMSRSTFSLTKNAESPEALLRWVDYFYSEEGSLFSNRGPEGDFWKLVKNDKGEEVAVYGDNVDMTNTEDSRALVTPAYGIPVPVLGITPPENLLMRQDPNEEPDLRFTNFVTKETEDKIVPFGELPMPQLYLTNEESDQVKDMATELQVYIEQMEAKFITGVEPIDNWDKYVETIKSMGVDKYTEVYQGAVDRYYEN